MEPDGSLKLVLSNSARQHPGVIDGDTLIPERERPAGLLFFDEDGDEMGGLSWRGDREQRLGGLLFDQIGNDETLRFVTRQSYGEGFEARSGMSISDRHPDYTLRDILGLDERLRQMTKEEALTRIEELRGTGVLGAQRMFVGREVDGAVVVDLRDGRGRTRLRLIAAADGAARIEFLDEDGRAVRSIEPPG